MFSNKNILFLVAHADDETLGCGGLISRLDPSNMTVVILSNGILKVRGIEENNRKDALEAFKILGVKNYQFMDYKDQYFDEYSIADIANSVSDLKINPDIIITHSSEDLNLDHKITADVAKIVGRPKNKPVSILECEIPNNNFWNTKTFQPNLFVDITETLENKIIAFSKYKNEFMEYPHPWSREGLTILAKFNGLLSGYKYAEAFKILRSYY